MATKREGVRAAKAYRHQMNQAILKLNVSLTYAQDGAPTTGARLAAEAIALLLDAADIKQRLFTAEVK